MLQEQLLAIVKSHGKLMALEVVDAALFPALEALVKKSETPIDDVLLAALKEPLKAELKRIIEAI